MTEPKYRCTDCKRKYKSDPIKDAKNREFMACNYIADKPRHAYTPDFNNKGNPKILYNKCIGNYFSSYWASLINFYPDYQKGILPYSGGLFEQPSKFVEVMNLVHNLIKENEQEVERRNKLSRNKINGRR